MIYKSYTSEELDIILSALKPVLSSPKLAEMIGVTKQTISNLRHGNNLKTTSRPAYVLATMAIDDFCKENNIDVNKILKIQFKIKTLKNEIDKEIKKGEKHES